MEKEKKGDTLIIKLILGVIVGIIIGLISNEQVISIILPIKFFLGELIFFVVPFLQNSYSIHHFYMTLFCTFLHVL